MVALYVNVLALTGIPRVEIGRRESRILSQKIPRRMIVRTRRQQQMNRAYHAAKIRVARSYINEVMKNELPKHNLNGHTSIRD